jgi:hypothetical protein
MAIGDINGDALPDLAVSFPGQGVWIRWNMGGWTLLERQESKGLTFANLDGDPYQKWLILNIPSGIWGWKYVGQGSWSRLHHVQASMLAASDVDRSGSLDLIISFPGSGIWLWRAGSGYVPLHSFNPETFVTGLIDSN